MAFYCDRCMIVFDIDHCPFCGKTKVREARWNDSCFLCEKNIIWAQALEEALKEKKIPVVLKKRYGIGMTLKAGPLMEEVKIYVPYSCLRDARRILKNMFPETEN